MAPLWGDSEWAQPWWKSQILTIPLTHSSLFIIRICCSFHYVAWLTTIRIYIIHVNMGRSRLNLCSCFSDEDKLKKWDINRVQCWDLYYSVTEISLTGYCSFLRYHVTAGRQSEEMYVTPGLETAHQKCAYETRKSSFSAFSWQWISFEYCRT